MAQMNPKRILGPTVGTGAAATLITAARRPIIIRTLMVVNSDSTDRTFVMSIGADALGTRIFPSGCTVKANGFLNLSDQYIVIDGADFIEWNANANLTVTAWGDEVQ